MSFGEKKKVSVDPTAKWSVTFMNEMSKSRGSTSRAGDTFNKALFSLIKADIKESSAAADKSLPLTARGNSSSVSTKLGNTVNTPEPSLEGRNDVPGDRRSRGLTRSFSLNEITALLAQTAPEEEIREPEPSPSPNPADSTHADANTDANSDTCHTETSTSAVSTSPPSMEISDSGTIQSTPRSDSGTTPAETSETINSAVNDAAPSESANSVPNSARDDTRQTETPATSTVEESSAPTVTRVKVPPLPVSPRSPRVGHRHTRSVGSQAMLDHAVSPRSKNSNGTPTSPRASPRDSVSPRGKTESSPRASPRESVTSTGAVVGASATETNSGKDKNSSDKQSSKDKKRTLKKRSSKRTRPPSTITAPNNANNSAAINSPANNSNLDASADSPRSVKALPNKSRRVSNSVSQIGQYRRGSISSDTLPVHSPRARTLRHVPRIDASAIEATSAKLNLDSMSEELVSIQEKLLFPSVKSEFSAAKLQQMPLSWVMQRMPLLRAKRDLAFKHHMHVKQLRSGKAPSPLKKDLSNITRWSSSDINKIRPGPSQSVGQSQSLTNSPVKAVSNTLRHVRAGSGNQPRRMTSIQLIPTSPRDSDPNKESKSSPKSGEEVKK